MPCYFPLQAHYSIRDDGKKDLDFSQSSYLSHRFQDDTLPKYDLVVGKHVMSLPCGRCRGCRLEKSRQWAVRCVHESKCFKDNCYVTLTYAPDKLPSDGSLVRRDVQNFIKRLRLLAVPPYPVIKGVSLVDQSRKDWILEFGVRVFYCGEYGEVCARCGLSPAGKPPCCCFEYVKALGRPHFHLCLFNFDFPDRVRWKKIRDFWQDTSEILSSLWTDGFATVGDFSFETAAYVARYCTKKVNGDMSEEHYKGKVPEFAGMSLKPGIGKTWFDRYGKTDLYPHDNVISRGAPSKPPRYYHILWEREDPEGFAKAKEARRKMGEERSEHSTFRRLADRFKCMEARTRVLLRSMERGY